MRIYLWILALILSAALIAPYFLKGRDGQPLMRAEVPAAVVPGALGEGDTVFRWQDENGVWQFGEKAPDGVNSHAVRLQDESGITPLESGWQIKPLGEATGPNTPLFPDALGLLTRAPQIIQAAESARNAVDDHTGELKKLLDQTAASE